MLIRSLTLTLTLFVLCFSAVPMTAQQAAIALSKTTIESGTPVEITADSLAVAQETGQALFEGNAKAAQGPIRLNADKVTVDYNQSANQIEKITAVGGVYFTNGVEVVEGDRAVYQPTQGIVAITGNVLLVQGPNTIAGDHLDLNLTTSAGTMTGNVKTIFTPTASE